MLKIILLLLLPMVLFAQYWGERVTEKSFEYSETFFKSYYLDPVGINRFRDVAPGLFNDPFLNLYLNPAHLPEDSLRNNHFHLDFRSDRQVIEVTQYIVPTPYLRYDYAGYHHPIDPRWYSQTRTEPEPIAAFGLLLYPFGNDFLIGGTFQSIYREEPYYQLPTSIYNARYGYDYAGKELGGSESIPITDRYGAEDQMLVKANSFSLHTAYQISEKIRVGASLNAVKQNREGIYSKLYNSPYTTTEDYRWFNLFRNERKQDYDHMDFSAGLMYQLSEKFVVGVKAGYLDGEATQDLIKSDSSSYKYEHINDNWSNSFRSGSTTQNWKNEGNVRYANLQLIYSASKARMARIYYAYSESDIEISNQSTIRDTSRYAGYWSNSNWESEYDSWSVLNDKRYGYGKRKTKQHQAHFSVNLKEIESTSLKIGLYFSQKSTEINSTEPVLVDNQSRYHSESLDKQTMIRTVHDWWYKLYEDKSLVWTFSTEEQTFQIPVILNFRIANNWNLMLGVNRIWRVWSVKDETIAYFSRRLRDSNGQIEDDSNFGERYTEPSQSITENTTEFMTGIGVNVSPSFRVNLLADPQVTPHWHLAQWWLSFGLTL